MSAFICTSVWAVAVRPTGPAATEPSAPSVNLLSSSLSAPRALITSMTRSVDETPIWNPMLPPSMRTVPGADHPRPPALRQDRYPFPYFPPTPHAAVLRPGTMTMQWALARRSSGRPLSGADTTSENTAAASVSRLPGSSSCAMSGTNPRVPAMVAAMINLTMHLTFHLLR